MSESKNYHFYLEGEQYQQDFISSIKSAKETICLQTYIFKLDGFGTRVYDALLEKAKQGVIIDLVIDYIGSYFLEQQIKKKLLSVENFNVTFFNPISTPKILQAGRRLHHKILIIDSSFAIVGGINTIEGTGVGLQRMPRLDFAVKVNNKSIKNLYRYCMQISHIVTKGVMDESLPQINIDKDSPVVFHHNDWINNRKEITSRYLNLIKKSQKSIHLIHGYFFPSFRIINNIISKSRQGVRVVLILPKYSDWQSWVWATEYLYSKLIKNGIEIFEWQPSELHGKLAILSDEFLSPAR